MAKFRTVQRYIINRKPVSNHCQYFREEPKKDEKKGDFKSVVPPIPIFDKFGKTFSKGTVY